MQTQTLFDTRPCWPHDQAQQESVLYGEDLFCTEERDSRGSRFVTLSGPDGSIELHEDQWREVFASMFPPPVSAHGGE